MLRAIGHVLLMTLFGAVGVPLVMFIYQGYLLIDEGVRRDQVPLQRLVLDVMELDAYATYGVAGGFVLGLIVVGIGLASARAERMRGLPEAGELTPDEIIRAEQGRIADEYIAERRGEG